MPENEMLRLAGRVRESIVDGPGLRYTIFTQGCPHHCLGCHNPHTWPAEGGEEVAVSALLTEIKRDTLLRGVTLSGGEPFEQAEPLAILAERIHEIPLNVWVYTGYMWEHLLNADRADWNRLLAHTDVLVDGLYEQSLKSYALKFRGSANQRLISVKKSLAAGAPILWEN